MSEEGRKEGGIITKNPIKGGIVKMKFNWMSLPNSSDYTTFQLQSSYKLCD